VVLTSRGKEHDVGTGLSVYKGCTKGEELGDFWPQADSSFEMTKQLQTLCKEILSFQVVSGFLRLLNRNICLASEEIFRF
jgi:hypothetical protein